MFANKQLLVYNVTQYILLPYKPSSLTTKWISRDQEVERLIPDRLDPRSIRGLCLSVTLIIHIIHAKGIPQHDITIASAKWARNCSVDCI